jgi:DNA invertase Pin-like site-specific DNA recombinase
MSNRRNQFDNDKPAWWDGHNDRAMLICRISDKKQKDGVSLESQEHHARDYARRVGLNVVAARPFQESAKKSVLRREFHAAIEEAQRSKIKHLVFYVWDRIARNFTDCEMLEELVREDEVTVHVATGAVVLHARSDDSVFFQLDINIAQAKQENRTRCTKTIDGMEQRCRNGWYPSRPPWFYRQQPVLDDEGRPKRRGSTVEGPTEEGRRLVRREMELHLCGYSLDRIREVCLTEGLVPAKYVRTYHRSMIDRHLKCEFYAALPDRHADPKRPGETFRSQFTWRDTWYEAKHEPIFTADEWERLKTSFGQKAKYKKLKHDGLFAQGPLSLTCADPECGCKITYAPVHKAGGTTYRYYRCADGRRVHRDRDEAQVYVKENDILDQLGGVIDGFTLTADLVEAIVRGLNETHRATMKAKERAAEGFRAEAKELEAKEDRLFDRFDANEIDRTTYDRQLLRLRDQKAETFEKLRQIDRAEDEKYLVTAERVLELAKNAKSLWEARSPSERRDFLERLVWNPRLDGRTVRYDVRKPFDVILKMAGSEGWRPQRDRYVISGRRRGAEGGRAGPLPRRGSRRGVTVRGAPATRAAALTAGTRRPLWGDAALARWSAAFRGSLANRARHRR